MTRTAVIGLLARSGEYVDELADGLPDPGKGLGVETDISDTDQVEDAFAAVREAFGPVDVLVNHASATFWKGLMDVSLAAFEHAFAVNGRGAFLCSREAVGDMLDDGGGTVIFTGATTAVRGRGGAIGFSAAKFAARGMAEDMTRELSPEGIHVAHVVIDGQILPAEGSAPDRDRESYTDGQND